MITETDERIIIPKSEYIDDFRKIIDGVFNTLIHERRTFVEYDWGMDRVQKHQVINRFDELIKENGGFELDGRTLRHAHGIGNNSEYDIVDKDLVKVGSFYCNSDMFGGVYTGVTLDGTAVKKFFIGTNRFEEQK